MQRAAEKKRRQQQHKQQNKRSRVAAEMAAAVPNQSAFAALADQGESSDDEQQLEGVDAASASVSAAASAASSAPTASPAAASSNAASAPAAVPRAPFVRPSPNPFVRVKAGNFSRLLYSNPVCLLTTSTPLSANTATSADSNAAALSGEVAVAVASSPAAPAATVSTALASSAVAAAPASALPRRNVMTISWLTATSNHGEFVCSMNASRYSAHLLAAQGASGDCVGSSFVLSVPVAGMETIVKAIGGCSGKDAAQSGAKDKIAQLGVQICRPGNKPIREQPPTLTAGAKAASVAAAAVAAASASSASAAASSSSSQGAPKLSAADEESLADIEDAALDLIAVSGCAAHLVCRVVSSCCANASHAGDHRVTDANSSSAHCSTASHTPRVSAHNILFCSVVRAYVHRDYWANGNNFIATTPRTPPYLTFLGSGNFAHVTNPAFAQRQ